MTRYRDDTINLTRRGKAGAGKRRVGIGLPIFVFISLALLALSRINHSALIDARRALGDVINPVLNAAMVPIEPLRRAGRNLTAGVDLAVEVERLKNDNQKLANWEWRARQLERRVADLEHLAKAVAEQRLEFITGRVIGDSSGAFRRSVIIDAGSLQNITGKFPVINGEGLVGRVVDVGRNTSRVVLLTDLNSRVPVSVGSGAVRAIMAGDNGATPRLIYVAPGAALKIGDDVWTSGMGGGFPQGLRIGTVSGSVEAPRVALRADLDTLQYVSVLFYSDPVESLIGNSSVGSVDRGGGTKSRQRSSLVVPPDLARSDSGVIDKPSAAATPAVNSAAPSDAKKVAP